MNLLAWFHHSLRHQCLTYRLQPLCRASKTCHHQVLTYTIWMNNLHQRKLRWPNLLTSALTKTLTTMSKNVAISLVWPRTWTTLMIPRKFSTTSLARLSSTKVLAYHEALTGHLVTFRGKYKEMMMHGLMQPRMKITELSTLTLIICSRKSTCCELVILPLL